MGAPRSRLRPDPRSAMASSQRAEIEHNIASYILYTLFYTSAPLDYLTLSLSLALQIALSLLCAAAFSRAIFTCSFSEILLHKTFKCEYIEGTTRRRCRARSTILRGQMSKSFEELFKCAAPRIYKEKVYIDY